MKNAKILIDWLTAKYTYREIFCVYSTSSIDPCVLESKYDRLLAEVVLYHRHVHCLYLAAAITTKHCENVVVIIVVIQYIILFNAH